VAASVRAAEEAAAVLAPAEALRHLTSALKLWERVPDSTAVTGTDRVELTLRAAEAASAAGDAQRAVSLTEDAATTADPAADPARAARVYERLGLHLLETGRAEDALRARARALELVPVQPPTPLRALVTAAMAQALFNARRRDEARRWCDEALMAARGAGSADDEADVLITLGMIQQYDDPAQARSLYAAGRARAADAATRRSSCGRSRISPGWSTSWGIWQPPVPPATTALRWPSEPALAGPESGSGCAARNVWSATALVPGTSVSGWPGPFRSG